jgi:phosphatidylserine/phosphatidylglycerophosphate/cardiolipin synthase-like enzyme
VLDGGQSAQKWSPHKTLLNAGAKLRRETLSSGGKLHHKLIVLDDHTVIGGSFNYTGPANQYNDENLFLVRNPDVDTFFKTEVKRVFESNALSADFK